MCFSAGASFSAAAVLGIGGTFILSQVTSKKQVLFASIPCIFALQQLCEGLVWVSLNYGLSYVWQAIGMYGFLFFAIPFWPLWIPLSTYVMETNKLIKRILFYFLLLGIIMFVLSLITLILTGATAQVLSCHIRYSVISPYISNDIVLLFYGLATIVPMFISTTKYMKLFGVVVLLSLFAAAYFYTMAFISTWCFFGAILSILIFMIVHRKAQ